MKRFIVGLFVTLIFAGHAFAADGLTLGESVTKALDNSPAIIDAREKLKASDARLGQAFGAVLPNLSLSANMGSLYQQPIEMNMGGTLFSYGTEEVASTSGYTLSLTQPLFTGGKLINALDMAKFAYDAERHDYKVAEDGLTYDVISSYYGVLRAQKMKDLSKESLDLANSHLDQVKAMYNAGISTKADVLRSEVQAANSEQTLTKASNALELSKGAFNNILGRGLDEPVELAEKEFANESVALTSYAELTDLAFNKRPDWLSFELGKKISEKNLSIAYGGYFPAISLIGKYGNSKMDYPTYLKTSQNTWAIMASASWTLFDGLSTQSRIAEADANLRSLGANENKMRNGILLEIKDANLNLKSALEVVVSAKKAVDSAVENYGIAEQKYKSGAGSNLEVIDAQVALTQAKTSLYEAQFDVQTVKAKLNKVIGVDIYKLF